VQNRDSLDNSLGFCCGARSLEHFYKTKYFIHINQRITIIISDYETKFAAVKRAAIAAPQRFSSPSILILQCEKLRSYPWTKRSSSEERKPKN